MEDEEKSLWDEYFRSKSIENRNALIEYYYPLLKKIAIKYHSQFNAKFLYNVEDFISFSAFGLIEAIGKYNPVKNGSFTGYSYKRIRGSIIDQVRYYDLASRGFRKKINTLKNAEERLKGNHKSLTYKEIGKLTGFNSKTIEFLSCRRGFARMESINELTDPETGNEYVFKNISDNPLVDTRFDPVNEAEKKEFILFIEKILKLLSKNERHIYILRHYEKLKQFEIAMILGVSSSRVSQILSNTNKKIDLFIKKYKMNRLIIS